MDNWGDIWGGLRILEETVVVSRISVTVRVLLSSPSLPVFFFSFFSLSFTLTYTTFAIASLLGIIRCGEERSPDNAHQCTFLRKTPNTAGHTPRYTCGTEQFQPANVKEEPTRQLQLCILKNNKLKFHPLHIQRQWVLFFIVEYV